MFNKKLFVLSVILIFLFGIINIKAFSYGEDNLGNSYYESDENIKVPSIEINNLITLKPWVEPANPVLGMIYLDIETNRLKFYDGEKWYFISLSDKFKEVAKEEIISQSESDTSETISEEESSAIFETETTESTNESSSSSEVSSSEENFSVSEENLNESAEFVESSQAPETSPEIPLEIEKTKNEKESKEEKSSGKSKEECHEECNPVCEEVESCSQDCSTDEEGNEICEESCTTEEVCEEVCAPEELFDITFNLDKSIITNSSLLSGVVTFESFGLIPTLVNLTFIIFNEGGKEIYVEKSSLVISTEELLRWNYDSLQDLEYGKYVAVVQTLYGDNVFDEFRQDFEIKQSFWDKINSWFKEFFKISEVF